ncbi:MAG: HNH endonuclease [bacterium]|nr:HNH endonuclease [bacterium]
MTITSDIRERVRQYANCACEFCGVTETDAGGQLTIDHYRPKTKGGTDDFENLLYCCARCNQYKMDYWPKRSDELLLWNPREEPSSQHFLELDDGTLHPLTPTGVLTLKRLRLNRPPLVTYRYRKQQREQELHLLTRYREIVALLEQLQKQTATLLMEQQELLAEQQRLLRLLLRKKQ